MSLVAGALGPAAHAAGTTPALQPALVPYQLIAKAYTELLGRAPDPAGWRTQTGWWASQHRCDSAAVQAFLDGFVRAAAGPGGELAGHRYSAAELTLGSYRLVLNRDPDLTGFTANRDAAAAHGVAALVAAMDRSREFTTRIVPEVCGSDPDDGVGPTPAETIPDSGTPTAAPDRTAELQALVGSTRGTVALQPDTVYGLSRPLVVPSGVTVTTAGGPAVTDYLHMARIVRLPSFSAGSPDTALVDLEGDAALTNVWVDGQRSADPAALDPTGAGGMDVELRGGSVIDGRVADDRLTNATGRMAVVAWGGNDGIPGEAPCGPDVMIEGNLIDGYASRHLTATGSSSASSDGIQVWCGSGTVVDNSIVDTTDAPIVLFAPAGGGPQASVVSGNTIVSAGNSSFYGIAADPLAPGIPRCDEGGHPAGAVASKNYTGARIVGNHLWTGDRTHINVLLSAGTHEDLGSCEHPGVPGGVGELNGTGGLFEGNDDAGLETRTDAAIYVGGMLGATVLANTFDHVVLEPTGLPVRGTMVVATGEGTAQLPNYAVGLRTDIPYIADTALADDHANNAN